MRMMHVVASVVIAVLLSSPVSAQTLTLPTSPSTLAGTSQLFEWNNLGAEYWLQIGTTVGAYDIHNSGSLGTSASSNVTDLPCDGSTLWVRLWERVGTVWSSNDYQFTAWQPDLISRLNGTQLSSYSVDFSWSAGASDYWLFAGSSPGGGLLLERITRDHREHHRGQPTL